ncbi:TadG family pilus assembly protein [Thermodesulfobacteriota bacterium]
MKKKSKLSVLRNEKGVLSFIAVFFLLFVGLVIAGFVIDFGYRHVARNQLQNSADAGALAGTRALYYENGSQVNDDGGDPLWTDSANDIAYYAARENKSAGKPVELYENGEVGTIDWVPGSGNVGDIQRGHWSFANHKFTDNPSIVPIDLGLYTAAQLDANINYINAVRVITRRQASPVKTFFANIFGYDSFTIRAEAVAYRGFAGDLAPGEVDIPIAVCIQSICNFDEVAKECIGAIECNYGRMLNSGNDVNGHNSAGWTNFYEDCSTANRPTIEPILLSCNGNPDPIQLAGTIGTTGGVVENIIEMPNKDSLMKCWKGASYDIDGDREMDVLVDENGDGLPEYPWEVKVPVINCPGNNVGTCSEVLGAMSVTVIWILEKENKINDDAPYIMWNPDKVNPDNPDDPVAFWDKRDEPDGIIRWNSFVDEFGLKMIDGSPAHYNDDKKLSGWKQKSVYFLPQCIKTEPAGGTGGKNLGTMAKIPVLVSYDLIEKIN